MKIKYPTVEPKKQLTYRDLSPGDVFQFRYTSSPAVALKLDDGFVWLNSNVYETSVTSYNYREVAILDAELVIQ